MRLRARNAGAEMIRWHDIIIDRPRRMIYRNGVVIEFPPAQFQLACALILAGPMTKGALFDLLYDDREDGGPVGNTIDVGFCQLKPRFARLGLMLCANGQPYWWHKRYWAEPINRKEGDAIERRERNSCVTESDRPLLPQKWEGPL